MQMQRDMRRRCVLAASRPPTVRGDRCSLPARPSAAAANSLYYELGSNLVATEYLATLRVALFCRFLL